MVGYRVCWDVGGVWHCGRNRNRCGCQRNLCGRTTTLFGPHAFINLDGVPGGGAMFNPEQGVSARIQLSYAAMMRDVI